MYTKQKSKGLFLSADDNNDSARMSKSFKIILGICAALLAVVVLAGGGVLIARANRKKK